MHRKLVVTSICLALLLACVLPFAAKVFAVTTKLQLDPPSIVDETQTPGKNITITVKVADVVNMFAYELKIYFKNTILNATNAVRPAGHFLEPVNPSKQFIPMWDINNNYNATYGRVWLSFTLLSPEVAQTGSGTLVQITFHVLDIGETPITFAETKLADNTGGSIPHDDENSYFKNSPPPPPPKPAFIYVDPESIIDVTLTPCHTFSISINIINGTDVLEFEFKLSFDPTILEATGVTEGTYLSNVGPTTILVEEIDNTTGFVRFSVTLNAPPGANGDGTLATINFHVIGNGATNLILSNTSLTDSTPQPIPHTTKNGYFANVILAKLYVDPPEIINSTIMPGDIFTLNITIKNVQNLYGYEFHLGYNTAVLTCFGVLIHPVQGEMRFTTKFSVDDYIGDVFVNVTYMPPANPISTIPPLALATLYFKVDVKGVSELPLHDTKLVDPSGNPISHETGDGFFQSVTRDVAVISVIPSKTKIYEGRKVNVSVTVENQGDYFNETFDVTAFYETTPIGTQTVHDLPISQNKTLIFTWNTIGLPPCHNYSLKAEATPVPYETDLADNTLVEGYVKIKLMGDVNGDRFVDLYDLTAVALAFSSKTGDPNWNPEADFIEDGVIDIFDLVVVTINYGRSC